MMRWHRSATAILSFSLVAVFIVQLVARPAGIGWYGWFAAQQETWPVLFWTPVTSLFLHNVDTWWHILANLFFLLLVGLTFEPYWSHFRLLAVFLIGGAIATLFQLPLAEGIVWGASGGVSAIMGFWFSTHLRTGAWKMGEKWTTAFSLSLCGLVVLVTFVLAVVSEWRAGVAGNSGDTAHLVGMVLGMGLAFVPKLALEFDQLAKYAERVGSRSAYED